MSGPSWYPMDRHMSSDGDERECDHEGVECEYNIDADGNRECK
jgi:hypothetical protein